MYRNSRITPMAALTRGLFIFCFIVSFIIIRKWTIARILHHPVLSNRQIEHLILPLPEDFAGKLHEAHLYSWSDHGPFRLMGLDMNQVKLSDDALGGGWSCFLFDDKPGGWATDTRYIIYKTPEAALSSWRNENTQQLPFSHGAFSNAPIGDACDNLVAPGLDELHFIRANVSVDIRAHNGKSSQQAFAQVQTILETWARVQVERIDRIKAQCGKIDMSNLPPTDLPRPARGLKKVTSDTKQ